MTRRALVLIPIAILLIAESLYFGSSCAADLLRLKGERAFLRNDLTASYRAYRDAEAYGGDPERMTTDLVELLLFGLDQAEAGVRIDLPLPPDESLLTAHHLVSDLILTYPYKSYYWSLASDVYFLQAWRERQTKVIDLSRISEDELDNLLREEWLGFAALLVASRLEPNNHIYHDLLTELYLERRSEERAAPHTRSAVRALPELEGHLYLSRPVPSETLLEAALAGFRDALEEPSLIHPARIECEAGRLLARLGREREALEHFARALEAAPRLYDAVVQSGYAHYKLGNHREAIDFLLRASALAPQEAWPHYVQGLAHRVLGEEDAAIEAFRRARERSPRELRFFHALGESLESAGQFEEAERQFRAAANVNADRPDAWSKLLAFYVRRGDSRSASEVCGRIRDLEPIGKMLAGQCTAPAGRSR